MLLFVARIYVCKPYQLNTLAGHTVHATKYCLMKNKAFIVAGLSSRPPVDTHSILAGAWNSSFTST